MLIDKYFFFFFVFEYSVNATSYVSLSREILTQDEINYFFRRMRQTSDRIVA
jgi:hypothetical protein